MPELTAVALKGQVAASAWQGTAQWQPELCPLCPWKGWVCPTEERVCWGRQGTDPRLEPRLSGPLSPPDVSSFSLPCCRPDFDANNIFKAFFGGPGGFSFEGGCSCWAQAALVSGALCGDSGASVPRCCRGRRWVGLQLPAKRPWCLRLHSSG